MGIYPKKNSNSSVEDVAKGATKGVLEWSSETIIRYITKLKNKEIGFIQDEKTIKLVREIYNSGESKFYNTYIKDKELLFLINMGLILRKLEEEDRDRLANLRDKIYRKYDIKGLHIAQFVQNGILNRYIGISIDEMTTLDKFQEDILKVLHNIDKYVLFVEGTDNSSMVIRKVGVMSAYDLPIFIVSGIGSAADIVKESEDRIKEFFQSCELEKMSRGKKEILFFKRIRI